MNIMTFRPWIRVLASFFLFSLPALGLGETFTYHGMAGSDPVSMILAIQSDGRAEGRFEHGSQSVAVTGVLVDGELKLTADGDPDRPDERFLGRYRSQSQRFGWPPEDALEHYPVTLSGEWAVGDQRRAFELALEPFGDGRLSCEEMRSQPERVFRQQPDLGSGHGSPLSVEYDCPESLLKQDFLKRLHELAETLNGSENLSLICGGTIEYAKNRYFLFRLLKAGFVPRQNPDQRQWGPSRDEMLNYLAYWSVQSLYNRRLYEAFVDEMALAERRLAQHYAATSGLNADEAAQAAANGIELYLRRAAGAAPARDRRPPPLLAALLAGPTDLQALDRLIRDSDPRTLSRALSAALILERGDVTINRLLTAVPDLNHSHNPDPGYVQSSEPPLFASLTQPERVRQLLAAGAQVDSQSGFGKTALYYAIQFNRLDVAELLIAAGANVNHQYPSAEALDSGERRCRYSIRRGLRTPLMHAAQHAGPEMLSMLLEAGADLGLKDDLGDTAMAYAELGGKPANADFLNRHLMLQPAP
ncbi:hypothetical protein GCM10022265_30370 [Marinobacter xestospongiae]